MVGLTLLTVCVFGIAFNTMLGLNGVNILLPAYRLSLLASVAFSFVGLAGLLLLSKGRATIAGSASFPRKSFSILALGIAINLVAAPIQAWLGAGFPLPVNTGGFSLFNVAILVSGFMMPLGTVFSTYGWAAIFSDSTKRQRPVLLVVLAVFAAIVVISLLI
jgi:hypothetical protein